MYCHAYVLHCMSYIAWVVLHGLHCMGCIAWVALHGLHCMGCIAWVALHGLHCMGCIAGKGVFKGGGGFRGFKPPPRNFQIFLKSEGKEIERKKGCLGGGGGGGYLLTYFWGCIVWVALHGLHCMSCIAWVASHGLPGMGCIYTALHVLSCICVALHELHCMGCIAWVALHGLHCMGCIACKGVFKGGFKPPPPKFSDFF